MADCLRCFLKHFPQKLKGEELKFTKDVFIQEQFALLEHAIDNYLLNAACKSFEDYLALVSDVLSIQTKVPAATLATVPEFRARRNLLLHAKPSLAALRPYSPLAALDDAAYGRQPAGLFFGRCVWGRGLN